MAQGEPDRTTLWKRYMALHPRQRVLMGVIGMLFSTVMLIVTPTEEATAKRNAPNQTWLDWPHPPKLLRVNYACRHPGANCAEEGGASHKIEAHLNLCKGMPRVARWPLGITNEISPVSLTNAWCTVHGRRATLWRRVLSPRCWHTPPTMPW